MLSMRRVCALEPRFVQFGRAVRYRKADIDGILQEAHRRARTFGGAQEREARLAMSATNRAAVHDSFQDGAGDQLSHFDVSRLTRAECAALLAQTKSLEGRLLARLLTSDESTAGETNSDGDRLLTIEQAAQLLSVTRSWLYHHAKHSGGSRSSSATARFGFPFSRVNDSSRIRLSRFLARAEHVPRYQDSV